MKDRFAGANQAELLLVSRTRGRDLATGSLGLECYAVPLSVARI